MINSVLSCEHSPKYIRFTIDIGMHEIAHLELCRECQFKHKPKFIIDEKIL